MKKNNNGKYRSDGTKKNFNKKSNYNKVNNKLNNNKSNYNNCNIHKRVNYNILKITKIIEEINPELDNLDLFNDYRWSDFI